jgi:spermidine synthase
MPTPYARAAITAIFFASGTAGLVYEVLWTRQLALIFGATTYAVSTVLATFMGGLALGSYVFGRWIDRRDNPLWAYAALEVVIGLYALLVPALFGALRPAYVLLLQAELPYSLLALARALLAACVLIVPATLMGGTFPILARFWVRTRSDVGRGAGILYFVNTAGAISGCVLAGFYLIEVFGISGTTWIAAATSISAGVAGALLATMVGASPQVVGAEERADESADESAIVAAPVARLVLFGIGLSGFTSLAYEVLWTRALLRYLYNSTYAFTTMLATFLAGIALGSAIYTTWLRRSRRPVALFAVLQMLVGVGFVLSSRLFVDLPATTAALIGVQNVGSFGQSLATMLVGSMLVLLPPTIFLGASFPLATDICARTLATLGHTVGRVYAVNTFGAILGSLGSGFVLIPAIGMQRTLMLLIVLNVSLAALLMVVAASSAAGRLRGLATGIAVVALAFVLLPGDLFRRTFPPPGQELVYYREGATDTVGVVSVAGQRSILYEDRRGTAGTISYGWNFFFGHLPMLLHPGTPRHVLHICFGVGNSLSAVAAHDELERVDNVELSPHVVGAAPYFWTNEGVIDHPKVRTIIDDGRNYVMATREQYDVIMLEPPETFTAGVIHLYTREFYEDALARLAPDGLMMQWIPSGEAPLEQERMLFRAFADVFPHVTAWRQMDSGCILLIGSRQPLTIDYQRLVERMARPKVRRDMELSKVRGVDHLLSFFIFDDAAFREFASGVPAVTDDLTVLDFTIPRYLGSGFGLGSWNVEVKEGGRTPWNWAFERGKFYGDSRRSVVPYLTNLDGASEADVSSRIASEASRPVERAPWIPQEQWQRW